MHRGDWHETCSATTDPLRRSDIEAGKRSPHQLIDQVDDYIIDPSKPFSCLRTWWSSYARAGCWLAGRLNVTTTAPDQAKEVSQALLRQDGASTRLFSRQTT